MVMDSSKTRSLWLAGVVVGLIAALAYYAIGVVPLYEYRTDVFVGEHANDDGFQTFEPVSATESFILDTLFVAPTTPELNRLKVKQVRWAANITVVEAGKTIRIHSMSAEDGVDRIRAVHQFIADGILARLKPRAAYIKARLDSRLLSAEEGLKVASNNLAIFSEIVADAEASEVKTRERARELADQIAGIERSGRRSSPAVTTGGEGVDNEVTSLSVRGQLDMYQKLGLAEIPFLRADSARTVVSLSQTGAQSRQAVRDLTEQIGVFREPTVTQFMLRSVSPTRSGLLLPMIIGLVAGLVTYYAARAIFKRKLG